MINEKEKRNNRQMENDCWVWIAYLMDWVNTEEKNND